MKTFGYWKVIGVAGALAGLVAWPGTGQAQLDLGGILPPILPAPGPAPTTTVTGQASAVQATVFGFLGNTTLELANTGALSGPTDALDASQPTGNLLGALTAEVPSATTIGYPDQVDSAASLANLALSIAGNNIGADFLMSQASAILNIGGVGSSTLSNLSLNGVPVPVTGDPNQVVSIPGGQMVINEQQTSPAGIVVNALHVIVSGVADVVMGSSVAAIQ
jgi:hypothetical protein